MTAIAVLLSLGVAYYCQDLFSRAAETYERVLDVLVPIFGEKNDCAIHCMGSLADAQRRAYNIKEAGVLVRKALALSEETLGLDHPITLVSYLNISIISVGSRISRFRQSKTNPVMYSSPP
jgi:hypothetical protein